jgi:hypothetical protein
MGFCTDTEYTEFMDQTPNLGPVTLVELDNAEDDANHVHSVWPDPSNDFGADLLLQHHLESPHGVGRSNVRDQG